MNHDVRLFVMMQEERYKKGATTFAVAPIRADLR